MRLGLEFLEYGSTLGLLGRAALDIRRTGFFVRSDGSLGDGSRGGSGRFLGLVLLLLGLLGRSVLSLCLGSLLYRLCGGNGLDYTERLGLNTM